MTREMTDEAVMIAAIAVDRRRQFARIAIYGDRFERGSSIIVVMNLAEVALQNQGENQQPRA